MEHDKEGSFAAQIGQKQNEEAIDNKSLKSSVNALGNTKDKSRTS